METSEQMQPPQNNLKGIERFNSQDILGATVTLTQSLKQLSPEQTTASDFSHQQDLTLLRHKVSEGKVEVDLNDPDKLWLALNILYPKRIAENAYLIARSAQLKSLGANIDPTKVSAEQLHQAVLQRMETDPKLLPYLNSRQLIFGDQAVLKLIDSQLLRQTQKPKSAKTRVALATAAAFAGLTTAIGAQTPKTVPETTPSSEVTSLEKTHLLETLLKPFMNQALKQRQEKGPQVDQALNRDRVNFLILGAGSEKYFGFEELTDVILVASFIPAENRVELISIPRDTHAPEIDRFNKQHNPDRPPRFNAINTALISGGYPLIHQVVEDATGLSADFTLKLTLEGFLKLFGSSIKEIEVDVKEKIDDKPTFPIYFEKGKQKMDQKRLLQYVRSRTSTSEVARVKRQQEVIDLLAKAAADEFNSRNALGKAKFIIDIVGAIRETQDSGDLQTDYEWTKIISEASGSLSLPELVNASLKFPSSQKLVFGPDNGLGWEKRADKERPHLLTVSGGDYTKPDLVQWYWPTTRKMVKGLQPQN